jgi:hypothetical protein
MIKLVAVAFLVAIVSPAQALPRAAVQQPDSLVGVKRPGALQDYVTSVAAASDKRPKADITGLFVGF